MRTVSPQALEGIRLKRNAITLHRLESIKARAEVALEVALLIHEAGGDVAADEIDASGKITKRAPRR